MGIPFSSARLRGLLSPVLVITALITVMGCHARAMAADNCAAMARHIVGEEATITTAEMARPGFLPPPTSLAALLPPRPVQVTFCRIAGVIAPSIAFEVWLPPSSNWNGRLQGLGNGGMSGDINYAGLSKAVEQGYAGVSSNLGHNGGSLDGSWAVGRPDLVKDWGYRATHEMTMAAKALIAGFYGREARYAYFNGCSGGGRQGLIEAQRYPQDYDGILAGNPTIDFARLVTGGRLWQVLSNSDDTGQGLLQAEQLALISAAVNRQCDALDGVKDGVLNDPRRCSFDPESLRCTTGDTTENCLSARQVQALKRIYRGAVTEGGEQIYPGYPPGGELGKYGWAGYFAGPEPLATMQAKYATGFLRGLVYEDAGYDPRQFNYDRDVMPMVNKPVAGETLSAVIDGANPDLQAFREAGGKIIHYHGWNDPGVSALRSIAYYDAVTEQAGDNRAVGDFYRLFMVPGMQHCFGGPGAWAFGGSFHPEVSADSDHDMFKALEAWVEEGSAPAHIVATKYHNDNAADGVKFTRPLCPYPQVARFVGGDDARAENYRCE